MNPSVVVIMIIIIIMIIYIYCISLNTTYEMITNNTSKPINKTYEIMTTKSNNKSTNTTYEIVKNNIEKSIFSTYKTKQFIKPVHNNKTKNDKLNDELFEKVKYLI